MGKPSLVGQYRDGLFRRKVSTISTASTGYNLSLDESGTFFYLKTPTTCMIRLPRASSKHLGITYEFVVQEGCTAIDIVTNLDSSARIQGVFTSGSTDVEAQSIRPRTSLAGAKGELTCISSIYWYFEQALIAPINSSGEWLTTAIVNAGWSTGSTST